MTRSLAIRIAVSLSFCAVVPSALWADDGVDDKSRAAPESGKTPLAQTTTPAKAQPTGRNGQSAAKAETRTAAPAKKITLRTLLRSENPRDRAAGIQFVVKKKVVLAGPRLEEMAQADPVPGIRRLACIAIGALSLKEGMLTLRTVARKDSSEGVRAAAMDALQKLGGSLDDKSADQDLDEPPASVAGQAKVRPKAKGVAEKKKKCRNNLDCKGARVCKSGKCNEPPPPQPTQFQPSTGWALEASIIGFVGSAATLGLTIYSALEPEDLLPAIPLAASATLLTIIVAPSVRSGSKSVRDKSDVPGSLTLRVIGWMCFGLHIGGSLALATAIPFHWLKKDSKGEKWTPKTSWIMTNGVVAAVSLLSLSIEALIARRQAKRVIARHKQKKHLEIDGHLEPPANKNKPQAPTGVEKLQPPSKESIRTEKKLSFAPYLSPIVHQDGTAGAAFGIIGRF